MGVLELRMYFLHDGSLNRRGDWVSQRVPRLMFHVEMLTLGTLNILLFSRLRSVAFNRDNDICGCAHVEVSKGLSRCLLNLGRIAIGGGWEILLPVRITLLRALI